MTNSARDFDEIESLLHKAFAIEGAPKVLEGIDRQFREKIAAFPNHYQLLLHYNEFRINNADRLPRDRPQILLSGNFNIIYPNLHSYPLFEIADVVCISCSPMPNTYKSAIFCRPTTHFQEILKILPKGFTPDFFWDNQIEHNHFIPAGIEQAPFPIIASICHTFLFKSIEQVCTLFDRILPLSKFYIDLFSKEYPGKMIDIPFGLNWASFTDRIRPCWEKTIDVCVTFAKNGSPIFYNKRDQVIELAEKFKSKYGHRFNIVITANLPEELYLATLHKSLITINVTGIHGPYNYRTIEAMSCGSTIFQYDYEGCFFKNEFSELFVEGVHGVTFNLENFETKLLSLLENKEQTRKIAKEAHSFLKEKYTYKKLYLDLINQVQKIDITAARKQRPQKEGYHHVDMVYYYQNNQFVNITSYGILSNLQLTSWIKYNNLMILCSIQKNPAAVRVVSDTLFPQQGAPEALHRWTLYQKIYALAVSASPPEHLWIVEWNFLLLALENNKAGKEEIKKMVTTLQKTTPLPFDESMVIFKYYVDLPTYPSYQLSNNEFRKLNLELMQVIDNPNARAKLYRNFALGAACYFLTVVDRQGA